MVYAIIGLMIGILAGVFAPGYIPKEYATIFSVALMAGLDTVFGGLRAGMEGVFDATIFSPVSLSTLSWRRFSVTPAAC
jgi:small basic protein